jgi:hypothetical protein
MKTISELLRHADPVGYEPRRTAHERRIARERILALSRVRHELPQRRVMIATAIAFALVGIAGGFGYWSWVAAAPIRFEIRLAEEQPATGLREAVISGGRKIYLHQEAVVTNSDIAQAQVIQGTNASTFGISVTFNSTGAAKMLRATQRHAGRTVAILLDGEVVMAPVVRSPISTSAIISGNFTRAEADRITTGIFSQ